MGAQPNLGGGARVLYALVGIILIGWGLFGTETAWVRGLAPILGAIVLVEGLIGF